MNCPACGHPLSTTSAGGVTVDVCDGGCGGIWFDRFELAKGDEVAETAGGELLDVRRDPAVQVDPSKRYLCPKCTDDVVMMRHFWSVKRAVTIDQCPECSGVFLDAGELAGIRAEFPTEQARNAAADAYFAEVVDPLTFRPPGSLAVLAVKVGRARLIDNHELGTEFGTRSADW